MRFYQLKLNILLSGICLIFFSFGYQCLLKDVHITEEAQLTDFMLWNLAQKFTNESDIRTFAVSGLKVEGYKVDSSLTNNSKDINSAMHALLRQWSDSQDNARIAHKRLCKALRAVGKNLLISQVLQLGK